MPSPRISAGLFAIIFFIATFFGGISTAAAADHTRLRIHPGVGVQAFPAGIASRFQLTVRYRFLANWYVDVVGMTGGVHSQFGYSGSDQQYSALALGPGYSTGEDREGWEFRVSPRFSHVHHATFESWGDHFWANLTADSDGAVRHRSGAELAIGLTGPRFGQFLGGRFIWTADVVGNFLPSSDEMTYGLGVVLGLSLGRD